MVIKSRNLLNNVHCLQHLHLLICYYVVVAECLSGCTEGLMLCTTQGSGCCTYYSNDMCVSECPNDSVADCDFNCVERKLLCHQI